MAIYNDIVGEIVRVSIGWQYPDNQIVMNNICYRCDAAGGGDSRAALGGAVQSIFQTSYLPMVSGAVELYGYKVAVLNQVPTPAPVTAIAGIAGTGSGVNTPSQVRPLLRFQTQFTGRRYRGRLFLPPPIVLRVTANGYPDATLTANMNTIAASLKVDIIESGTTWAPVIAHRVKGNPTAMTSTYVFDASVPGLFGTQWKSGNTGRINVPPW